MSNQWQSMAINGNHLLGGEVVVEAPELLDEQAAHVLAQQPLAARVLVLLVLLLRGGRLGGDWAEIGRRLGGDWAERGEVGGRGRGQRGGRSEGDRREIGGRSEGDRREIGGRSGLTCGWPK